MVSTLKKFLRGSAGRAAEPEKEDDVQSGCKGIPQEGEIVGMFVARVIMETEHPYITDRTFCFSCITDVKKQEEPQEPD